MGKIERKACGLALAACIALLAACGHGKGAAASQSSTSPRQAKAIATAAKTLIDGLATGDGPTVCATTSQELATLFGSDNANNACDPAGFKPDSEYATIRVTSATELRHPVQVTIARSDQGYGGVILLVDGKTIVGAVNVQLRDAATGQGSAAPDRALSAISTDTRPAVSAVGRVLSGLQSGDASAVCGALSSDAAFSVIDRLYSNELDDGSLPAKRPGCAALVSGVTKSLEKSDARIFRTGGGLRRVVSTEPIGSVELLRTTPAPKVDGDHPVVPWIGTRAWLVKRNGKWLVLGFSRTSTTAASAFNPGS